MNSINITNGTYFNAYFEEHIDRNCVPFCEAMMMGTVKGDIFSEPFFIHRAAELHVSFDEYKDIMGPFMEFAKNIHNYDEIVLWFGQDAFCQLNLLTILAFLEVKDYNGKVYSVLVDDVNFTILQEKTEVTLGSYYALYNSVLVHHFPMKCPNEGLQRGIDLYFDYLSPEGKLARIIKDNPSMSDHDLLVKIMHSSEEYGLGDVQAMELIGKYRGR